MKVENSRDLKILVEIQNAIRSFDVSNIIKQRTSVVGEEIALEISFFIIFFRVMG